MGLKETKPPLYLAREAQGWRLPAAQWSGAIPSPKPLPRPVSAPPLAHKWGRGVGRHIHASATPFSCAKSQPAGSVLRSGKAPGEVGENQTLDQKMGSGWDQARAPPPPASPLSPHPTHVTRRPQHPQWATPGASANRHRPWNQHPALPARAGWGPRHFSCLRLQHPNWPGCHSRKHGAAASPGRGTCVRRGPCGTGQGRAKHSPMSPLRPASSCYSRASSHSLGTLCM